MPVLTVADPQHLASGYKKQLSFGYETSILATMLRTTHREAIASFSKVIYAGSHEFPQLIFPPVR